MSRPGRQHGTRGTYTKGCRCDDCKEAVARWQREYRAAQQPVVLCKPEPWMEHGACRNQPISWWFPPHVDRDAFHYYSEARLICATCPVQTECLDYALEHGERFGMWGGQSPRERKDTRRRRNRGAA